jgi:hypothetical protein
MILNRAYPEIPTSIFDVTDGDADLTYHLRCEEIWLEVVEEVLDPDYVTRSHHNVGTYDCGCRGPLCRKALREHPRRKGPAVTVTLREEAIYDPVLEYFHTVIKHRVRTVQQGILSQLKENAS